MSFTELMYVPKSVQFKGGVTLYDLELLLLWSRVGVLRLIGYRSLSADNHFGMFDVWDDRSL